MNNVALLIIALLVAFQLAFTALFLFTNSRGKTLSNYLLGSVFLLLAFNMATVLMNLLGVQLGMWIEIPKSATLFLIGPLFYLYTSSVLYKDFKLRKSYLWHSVPFIVAFILLLPQVFQNTVDPELLQPDLTGLVLFGLVLYIQMLIYLIRTEISMANYKKLEA